MPRYFIEVFYRGTNFSGFQVQKNAVTIQSEAESALFTLFRQQFQLTGSSRTDAGVHAFQNYFHFDSEDELFHSEETGNGEKSVEEILYSLNSILPADIVIKRIFEVPDKAHCRFDAISRHYKYYLYNKKNPFLKDTAYYYPYILAFEQLRQAAFIVLNTKEFAAFSKRNTQVVNFKCTLQKSEWIQENDLLVYSVVANRFLRGMVKGLVGTMLKVGTGKLSMDGFKKVIESRDCKNADFSPPSNGLFLVEVKFDYF
jgi:tRNA pseudouridine38-40 synthase